MCNDAFILTKHRNHELLIGGKKRRGKTSEMSVLCANALTLYRVLICVSTESTSIFDEKRAVYNEKSMC